MDADVAHLINELIHLSIWRGINSAVNEVMFIVGLSHSICFTFRDPHKSIAIIIKKDEHLAKYSPQ